MYVFLPHKNSNLRGVSRVREVSLVKGVPLVKGRSRVREVSPSSGVPLVRGVSRVREVSPAKGVPLVRGVWLPRPLFSLSEVQNEQVHGTQLCCMLAHIHESIWECVVDFSVLG